MFVALHAPRLLLRRFTRKKPHHLFSCIMKKITALLTLVLGTVFTLAAQEVPRFDAHALAPTLTLHTHADGTVHRGYCGTRFDATTAIDLAAFHAAREAGTLPRFAKGAVMPPDIGDVQTFNVLIDQTTCWKPTGANRLHCLMSKRWGMVLTALGLSSPHALPTAWEGHLARIVSPSEQNPKCAESIATYGKTPR